MDVFSPTHGSHSASQNISVTKRFRLSPLGKLVLNIFDDITVTVQFILSAPQIMICGERQCATKALEELQSGRLGVPPEKYEAYIHIGDAPVDVLFRRSEHIGMTEAAVYKSWANYVLAYRAFLSESATLEDLVRAWNEFAGRCDVELTYHDENGTRIVRKSPASLRKKRWKELGDGLKFYKQYIRMFGERRR